MTSIRPVTSTSVVEKTTKSEQTIVNSNQQQISELEGKSDLNEPQDSVKVE